MACQRITTQATPTEIVDPCNPTPCGSNAICSDRNRAAACQCIPEYFGDPYVACRPECTTNPECPSDKTCQNMKCIDPCPGLCGVNAECRVVNHRATCSCFPGYTGDPFTACRLPPQSIYFFLYILYLYVFQSLNIFICLVIEPIVAEDDPCDPNPCGPNSSPPRNYGGQCQCSCLPEMIGSPPNCRPECVINSDCPSDKACINRKCQDPCPGLCGINARCEVRNHLPLCICLNGYIGDPFFQCNRPISK